MAQPDDRDDLPLRRPHPLAPMPAPYLPKSLKRTAEGTPLHTACLSGDYDQVIIITLHHDVINYSGHLTVQDTFI